MKQIHLLDYEIGRLKLEEGAKREMGTGEECRNGSLISRLSSSIISEYMVHFDQIVDLLIDELLQDEVTYLNFMEAEHFEGQHP